MELSRIEKDWQADAFARALLMPKEQFIEKAYEHFEEETGLFNTSEIAKHFGVYATDAYLRGVELELFRREWD